MGGCGCSQEGYCFETEQKETVEEVNESGNRFTFERTTCRGCERWIGDRLL